MNPRTARGMSLIELVLVLAIVGILLGWAVPGYQEFVQRAQRTDAVTQLLAVAACQERHRAQTGAYDLNRCLPGELPAYRLAYADTDEPAGHAFTVLAEPIGGQERDRCGTLTLDHTGVRDVSAEGADSVRCWSGR